MVTLNLVAIPELKNLLIDDSFTMCMDAPDAAERFVQLDKDLVDLKAKLKLLENQVEVVGEELKSRNRKVNDSILIFILIQTRLNHFHLFVFKCRKKTICSCCTTDSKYFEMTMCSWKQKWLFLKNSMLRFVCLNNLFNVVIQKLRFSRP